jgi:hypothetical protein
VDRLLKTPNKNNERGVVLVITLLFALIAAIGVAAFLHLTKTQIVQVKLQSHSTKAFYTAEVGLEKAMHLLKNDFYYTPEGMEPSWADDKIFTAEGYIDLTRGGEICVPKYLSLDDPDYVNDFYPVLSETVYESPGNGGHKSTYQIHLSNLIGWTDRIWVKATGRYYRKSGEGFILEESRSILALVRAREISPWNNAIFAGEGQAGRVINGNVDVRGSVHLLGTSLGSSDLAMEFGGSGNVKNNYAGIPADLGTRIPPVQKAYGSEMLESLEAEVRVQHGKVALSGSSCLGAPDAPGNLLKETLEGVYITDGYGGNSGEANVYSDNGTKNPYDLSEFDLKFPRLSEPYGGYVTYMDCLRDNALVINSQQDLNLLRNIVPTSSFSFSNEKGELSMDGNGHLTVRGIVVVEGDVNFNKVGNEKTILYQGKGAIASAGSIGINCDLLTFSFSTFPRVEILGVMAANAITFNSAQINVMGVFYAENQIASQKQTSVAGTFFSNYFDMGQNVPSIYQVPDVIGNLPAGMIGNFRIWTVKRITWGEIPSGDSPQVFQQGG